MYCHCGQKFQYGEIKKGPLGWQTKNVQYCGRCGKMSHVVQEKEEPRYGPFGGRAIQSVNGLSDGTRVVTWWTDTPNTPIKVLEYTPYPYVKVNDMDQGRDHLMKLWHKLDAKVDQIRQPGDMPDEAWKVEARTYADVIAQLMHMFYPDANAVLAESMNRWKARQASTEHQSPGLGEALWASEKRFDAPVADIAPARGRKVGATTTKAAVKFDDKKITFIKHCLANGIQAPEDLAKMFGCTVADIKAAVDES